MKLIFVGPPGAGKGTQAVRIAQHYGIAHISTGDMLRAEMREKTELGLRAKSLIDKGELVPDEVILGMVRARIAQQDCRNGFLFDGFPRTVVQADELEHITSIDHVVELAVPFDKLIDRISGRRMCPGCGAAYHTSSYAHLTCADCGAALYQRDDDRAETVKNRLDVYQRQTETLISYYRNKGKLITIDGDQDVDKVYADVITELTRA